jgi:hypothetical protein
MMQELSVLRHLLDQRRVHASSRSHCRVVRPLSLLRQGASEGPTNACSGNVHGHEAIASSFSSDSGATITGC